MGQPSTQASNAVIYVTYAIFLYALLPYPCLARTWASMEPPAVLLTPGVVEMGYRKRIDS